MLQVPGKDSLCVCIEVKKHDSAGLLEKMETQLLELYLKAQKDQTHGIYVVFWFEDGGSAMHTGIQTLDEAALHLKKQAERLSAPPFRLEAKIIDCRMSTLIPRDPHRKPRKPKSKSTIVKPRTKKI